MPKRKGRIRKGVQLLKTMSLPAGRRFHFDFSAVSQARLAEPFPAVNRAGPARHRNIPLGTWGRWKREEFHSREVRGEQKKNKHHNTRPQIKQAGKRTNQPNKSAPAHKSEVAIPEVD